MNKISDLFKRLFNRKEPLTDAQLLMTITIIIFFGLYIMAMFVWGGGFLRPQQLFDIFNNNASLIIIACGLTIVMITGGIDISVGGIIALVVMSSAVYLNSEGGSVLGAICLSLAIGLAFGLLHGFLVAYLEIQPFIVTLAGMFFARGMTTIVSVNPVTAKNDGFTMLKSINIEIPWLGYIAKNGALIPAKIELGVVVAIVIVIISYLMLKRTKFGRNLYAVGGNPQSALMLGINVKRTKFIAHTLSGLLAGIAGFVFLMHTGAGNASNAAGAEMNAIASSIMGGTLLSGGVGNVIGTLFGVLTLSTIKSIVVTSGLTQPWWQSITTGAMLSFFIILQSVVLSNRGKGKITLPSWLKKKK